MNHSPLRCLTDVNHSYIFYTSVRVDKVACYWRACMKSVWVMSNMNYIVRSLQTHTTAEKHRIRQTLHSHSNSIIILAAHSHFKKMSQSIKHQIIFFVCVVEIISITNWIMLISFKNNTFHFSGLISLHDLVIFIWFYDNKNDSYYSIIHFS